MSGHNPRISSYPKCVNQVFTQFQLTQMCLDTMKPFLAWWWSLSIFRKGSGHNIQPARSLYILPVLNYVRPTITVCRSALCVLDLHHGGIYLLHKTWSLLTVFVKVRVLISWCFIVNSEKSRLAYQWLRQLMGLLVHIRLCWQPYQPVVKSSNWWPLLDKC